MLLLSLSLFIDENLSNYTSLMPLRLLVVTTLALAFYILKVIIIFTEAGTILVYKTY